MKRIITLILVTTLLVGCLSGCQTGDSNTTESGKMSIVCTVFPQYDWTRTILGDMKEEADLHLLVKDGADLHSYQPSAADIAMISNADLVIYVGGESDSWVEEAMKDSVNPNQKKINMMQVIGDGVTEEIIVEGMESEEEEESEEIEYDEHVWMSIENAKIISKAICDELVELDQKDAEIYAQNMSNYEEALNQLDASYMDTVEEASMNTVVFGDRFPFHYLMSEYGIEYYAAFPGCSADTEAAFETVIFLAQKVDEIGLHYICVVENSNQSIAKTIIENTQNKDQKIVSLNSMETISNERMEAGDTYLSIMESNLQILKTVLE